MLRERQVAGWAGLVHLPVLLLIAGVVVMSALHELKGADPIRLATFYRPLRSGPTPAELAPQLGVAVLTRSDEAYRDALVEAGFGGPVLQYLLANQASGPPGLDRAGAPCGAYLAYENNPTGIAGDFCSSLHPDERNFLHNGRGERLYSTQAWQENGGTQRAHLYLMNPAAPAWQAYVARRIRAEVAALGYAGVFLDNVDLSLHRGRRQAANSDGVIAEYPSDAAYREAVAGYLRAVRGAAGPVTIWANLTNGADAPNEWDAYLDHLDGVMAEAFVAGWDGRLPMPVDWEAQLRQVEATLARGKGLVAVGQGDEGDVARMRFALASYLLVARDGSAFRYADGSGGEDTSPAYYNLWTYPEYGLALGPPLGGRYRDGAAWRRDYGCASVIVDVAAQRGTIETNEWCAPYFRALPARIIGEPPRPEPE